MTTPLNQTKRNKWIVVALTVSAALLCAAVGVTRQANVYMAKAEAESKLAVSERELAASERQLAEKVRQEAIDKDQEILAFVGSLNYPIAMLDQQGKVTAWNAAAERDFGWTLADLQANGVQSIMPEEMRGRHHAAFGKAMHGGGKIVGRVSSPVQRVQCIVIPKDPNKKPIPVEVSVRVVREADGDVYAMANIDRQSRILAVDVEEEEQQPRSSH